MKLPIKPLPVNPSLELQRKLLFEPESNPTGHVPLEYARELPFDATAATYSRVNAWWLAEASWLAYWHDRDALAGVYKERTDLDCELIEVDGAECSIAWNKRFAIIAFRGTQPGDWADLLDDALFAAVAWDTGHVHQGFAHRLSNVTPSLQRALGRLEKGCRVWFTGHSLGAAVATLAAYRHRDVADGVYTFGSPLVGNTVFAGTFAGALSERSTRYVNDHDLVTRVPPEPFALPHGVYSHVEHGRWINKDGQISTTRPTVAQFVRDVFGRANVALDLVEMHQAGLGRSLPDALSDHTPLYYVLHCWNDCALHVEHS